PVAVVAHASGVGLTISVWLDAIIAVRPVVRLIPVSISLWAVVVVVLHPLTFRGEAMLPLFPALVVVITVARHGRYRQQRSSQQTRQSQSFLHFVPSVS